MSRAELGAANAVMIAAPEHARAITGWLEEGRSLDGPRGAVACALLHAGAVGDLRALLLRLPAAQVDGLIAQMESDPDRAAKTQAKEIIEARRAAP